MGDDNQITELSIVAVSVDDFLDAADLPRVQNKITVCFNPEREIENEASKLTGLTNWMLSRQSNFNENALHLLECFLQHLEQPICFIAHNGDRFDFPLLGQRFDLLGHGIYSMVTKWCDSIPLFKLLTPPSPSGERLYFSLTEVHRRAFGVIPGNLHSAEADVYTLMRCARSFGRAFIDAVNEYEMTNELRRLMTAPN